MDNIYDRSALSRERYRSALRLRLRRLWNAKITVLWSAVIVLFVMLAVFAPFIAPHDPNEQNLLMRLNPPSKKCFFGTDQFGRDILSRVIYGGRFSLVAGVISVSIGLVLGIPLGLVAGYFGGIWDEVIMRCMDILLAFPYLLLAIAIVSALGPGLFNSMMAIGIWTMPVYCRLVRASVLSVKDRGYIAAAHATGVGHVRILVRHILPNVLGPIIVLSTLRIADAILAIASLGFLGLGVQPPSPEWGTMLSNSRLYIELAPHTVVFPGLAILLNVLAFNIIGDSIRDYLDPSLRKLM